MKPLLIALLVIAFGTGGLLSLARLTQPRLTQAQADAQEHERTAAAAFERDTRPVHFSPAVAARVQAEDAASRPPPPSGISQPELQRLIADIYHVETSRFIQPDLLWITLPPDSDVQSTCQAIANVWAHRSGLPWVRVESWRGTQRLGQGTAQNGQPITP